MIIHKLRQDWIAYLQEVGLSTFVAEFLAVLFLVLIAIIIGYLADRLVRMTLISGFSRLANKSKTDWDDLLIEKKVFSAIAHLAPVIFIFYCVQLIFEEYPTWHDFILRISRINLVTFSMVILFRFMNVGISCVNFSSVRQHGF